MNDIQAVNKRESRRIYLEKEIDIKKMIKLKKLINHFNEENNLRISLIDDAREAFGDFRKSYGFFKGVRSVIVLKGLKNDMHLKEKLGYYGERLVIEATKLGLGTCWVGGTFDNKSSLFNSQNDESLVCVLTIGYPYIEKSLREKIIHSVMHRKVKSIDKFYISDTKKLPKWFIDGIELVVRAPSAKNKQPVRFEYKDYIVTAHVDEKNEFDLVDLGISKLHFEIGAKGKFDLGNRAQFNLE